MDAPVLEQLMGTYFHEDWPDQGGLWGTLDLFLSHIEVAEVRQLVTDVADVLATTDSEAELEALLDAMGSYVYLDGSDLTYRSWLEEIARRATAHASSTGG